MSQRNNIKTPYSIGNEREDAVGKGKHRPH